MDGRQALSKFIAERTTQAKFARKIGCSESHLALVLQGNRGVSLKLAKRISDETGGAVPMHALVLNEEEAGSAA